MWDEIFFVEFVDDRGVNHQEQWNGLDLALNRYMSVRKEYQRYAIKNGAGRVVNCDQQQAPYQAQS